MSDSPRPSLRVPSVPARLGLALTLVTLVTWALAGWTATRGPWIACLAFPVLAGVAIRWALGPMRRSARRIRDTVERVRAGDLEARVRSRPGEPLHETAKAVDALTETVSELVASNRELLQAVSHEMRTPIARLFFGLDELAEQSSAEKREGLLAALRMSVVEMSELTEELLRYHRLGESGPALKRAPVDLAEIVDDVASRWPGTEVDRAPAASMIEADAALVFRAIENLVSNAVRYATPPRVALARAGEWWRVTVDDEGRGIPEPDRARIFDPFVRLELSRSRQTGGAGLGLAIVARIVRAHGGRIRAESSPGGGARFVVELAAVD